MRLNSPACFASQCAISAFARRSSGEDVATTEPIP
jgi:hypothetical protein